MTIDYTNLKTIAKQDKVRVVSLLALAPQNDPFYIGTKTDMDMAEWFRDLWERFGYEDGIHLRRVHYQVASQKIAKPNGETYQNTMNDWQWLCNAGKYARYLGYVSSSSFVDRRNPEAIIHAHYYGPDDFEYENPEPRQEVEGGWDNGDEYYGADNDKYALPELPELPRLPYSLPDTPWLNAQGYVGTHQDYLIEIWCEKTTMNDILIPLCRQYGINLITGMGEMSITSVVDLLNRVNRAGNAARILYVSDYDPAGMSMPVAVARKIEFYLEALRDEGYDIALQPVILTADQVATYELPRIPVKDSDKRKANWEATQGAGQVELDALEALHPGELSQIVEAEILKYHDPNLRRKLNVVQAELQSLLTEETGNVQDDYQNEIMTIETDYGDLTTAWDETRERFADLVASFQEDISSHKDDLADVVKRTKSLYDEIENDLAEVGIEFPDIPSPDLPRDDNGLLYNSDRDYFDQLEYYQDFKN